MGLGLSNGVVGLNFLLFYFVDFVAEPRPVRVAAEKE